MQANRLAATVLALTLGVFACPFAWGQAAPTDGPIEVTVGAYVNDIQQPDFKANSYTIDLYVWFRWRAPDLDPYKTLEFMNRDASDDSNLRESLYDKPEVMPDGSLYSIIRYRGQFSTKFRFDKYPFDTQVLQQSLDPMTTSPSGLTRDRPIRKGRAALLSLMCRAGAGRRSAALMRPLLTPVWSAP